MKSWIHHVLIMTILLLTGCSNSSQVATVTMFPPTVTSALAPSLTPTLTATLPLPTPTKELINQVCSPIQGIDFSELSDIVSYEYVSPLPYNESGHPAIDFGLYHYKDYPFFPNFPIQAIISGKAILVQKDLYPYGNMIMTETRLNELQPSFLSSITQPTPLPPSYYSLDERCPVSGSAVTWDKDGLSLYVLYAHMVEKPDIQPGDQVTCGQLLGNAGKSGHAAEEHLHLEIRIGPSNAGFESIAEYKQPATPAERYNYCIWALSGVFQSIDPSVLLFR